jgi:hypothetical protein
LIRLLPRSPLGSDGAEQIRKAVLLHIRPRAVVTIGGFEGAGVHLQERCSVSPIEPRLFHVASQEKVGVAVHVVVADRDAPALRDLGDTHAGGDIDGSGRGDGRGSRLAVLDRDDREERSDEDPHPTMTVRPPNNGTCERCSLHDPPSLVPARRRREALAIGYEVRRSSA